LEGHGTCSLTEVGTTIGLYFNLSGACSFPNAGAMHTIGPGQHNIFFSSGNEEKFQIAPVAGQWNSLEINVPVSYYVDLFEDYPESQRRFITQIQSGKNRFYQAGIMPMTMPMKWIINTLQQCTRTGVLRRLFFEAKILELLMLQIEQSEYIRGQQSKTVSNALDLEALHEARSILDRNLQNPPTIRNLSRMVGINEFNLKKGFRNAFDTTIYGYVNGLKMQQARELILQKEKSIQEIAALSGYKNPQHFTVAFKKYFGQLPSMLKSLAFLLCNLEEVFVCEEVLLAAI
jgi:AraC-like DNA-binding protein